MKSMTGYARTEGRIGDRLCVVEIKTVNHRFLDIFLKTPKALAPLELSLKKYLGTKIVRGRVDATIQIENEAGNNVRVSLNLSLAKEYYKLINKLKKTLHCRKTFPCSTSYHCRMSLSWKNRGQR
jgi:uncharacterized protein (TIGR00255 family)